MSLASDDGAFEPLQAAFSAASWASGHSLVTGANGLGHGALVADFATIRRQPRGAHHPHARAPADHPLPAGAPSLGFRAPAGARDPFPAIIHADAPALALGYVSDLTLADAGLSEGRQSRQGADLSDREALSCGRSRTGSVSITGAAAAASEVSRLESPGFGVLDLDIPDAPADAPDAPTDAPADSAHAACPWALASDITAPAPCHLLPQQGGHLLQRCVSGASCPSTVTAVTSGRSVGLDADFQVIPAWPQRRTAPVQGGTA